jgi:hypothetical protein
VTRLPVSILLAAVCAGCAYRRDPPAGFGAAASEPRAVEIARALTARLGGQAAWDRTRYLTWNAMGKRRYLWDRSAGQVRLERAGPRSGRAYVIVFEAEGGAGRAWREGQQVTEPSELDPMLAAARRDWISDSWWLLMPWKLMDDGVVLRYRGRGETAEGRSASVLEVTFERAGIAPDGMYLVWVGLESGLVEQWAGFTEREGTEPAWTCPWQGWKRYGAVMLCGDHGDLGGRPMLLTDIALPREVPPGAFTSPDPIDWAAMQGDR